MQASDNVLLYKQQAERNGKQVRELVSEIERLKREVADARFRKEEELAHTAQRVADLELQNSTLQDENSAVNEERTKVEVPHGNNPRIGYVEKSPG